MPTFGDVVGFLGGQAFGTTTVPLVDLTGKTYIVTGANTGLGFECVKYLLQLHASKVILACRNSSKGQAAKTRILSDVPGTPDSALEVWDLDLSSNASLLAFSRRMNTSLDRLDGFVANAGVEMTEFQLTQGLETSLATNVVSTFITAIAAIPKLEKTATEHQTPATLSIVGSLIHVFAPDAQLEPPEEGKPVAGDGGGSSIFRALSNPDTADMKMRYPLTKLIGHLCTRELARAVSARAPAVTVNLVNPGWCASELGRHHGDLPLAQRASFALIGRTAEQGGRTLVHAVTGPVAGLDSHGLYLSECVVKEQSTFVRSARGQEVGARLWSELLQIVTEVDPDLAKIVS